MLQTSTFDYEPKKTGRLGRLFVYLYSKLGLIQLERHPEYTDASPKYNATNCTLINLMLITFSPMRENNLTTVILVLQVVCSLVAFLIRYGMSRFFY